jgi:uncharacterized protein (DUF2141 family)
LIGAKDIVKISTFVGETVISMLRKRFSYFILLVLFASLFSPRCAIVVPPTGGDKDTIPPVMVRSNPPIYSTNFNRQRITLTFNEFVQLKDIGKKLILSPPQERLPEFRIKGKNLELSFFEPLKDSTTYTLYFSDAITDLNEGNPMVNFEFAFSTGNEIDSLRFPGKVIDAFTLEPQVGVLVMLYRELHDSIPMQEKPVYVTKTNKGGNFSLSNLKMGDYKIFALNDGNSNYLFDQIAESIAYRHDTIKKSILVAPLGDSVRETSVDPFILRLFQEENRVLSLTDYSRISRRGLQLGFSRRPEGRVLLTPVNFTVDSLEQWYIPERSITGDTLAYWITNDMISNMDSLFIRVNYPKTDSLLNIYEACDTLRFIHTAKSPGTRSRKKDTEGLEKKPSLNVTFSASKEKPLPPIQPLTLTFSLPLQSLDNSLIRFDDMTDSLAVHTRLQVDSLNPRVYRAFHPWEFNKRYRFAALPGAFTDLNGVTNDTLEVIFSGINPAYFGTINLTLSGVEPNIIVELLTEKKSVAYRAIAEKDGTLTFNYVNPAKYSIRFIFDENRNGKWDTGWYLMGIQPERVVMFEEKGVVTIHNIRANWEYDLSFDLKK